MIKFYRCRTNPKGPLLKLHTDWEQKEMERHPDYYECDEDGLPTNPDKASEEPKIPFVQAK